MTAALDANVLVYATNDADPLHGRARKLVQELAVGGDIIYLFWPVITAYLRVVTHPGLLKPPVALSRAVENVERLLRLAHVRSPGEGADHWTFFRDTLEETGATGNLVHDAHLVALMRQHGVTTIWTHDRDFRKFDGIRVRDPFA